MWAQRGCAMSEKKTVVVASNNAHKIEEIRAILSAELSDA